MVTKVEALYKASELITMGWRPEPYVSVSSYNMFVGLVPAVASLAPLYSPISAQVSKVPSTLGKVTQDVKIADVRTALTLGSSVNFANTVFYFAITYNDVSGTPSVLANSVIVMVPPVGIMGKTMKEDPTINRHGFVFSDELQLWTKMAGSGSGATIVDLSDFYKTNITTDLTYDGTNVTTMKSYLSDMTAVGSPAKLTTYAYSGSQVTKITITDSTV